MKTELYLDGYRLAQQMYAEDLFDELYQEELPWHENEEERVQCALERCMDLML